MRATTWLIAHRLRRRWPALVLLAVVVGVGAGGALTALGAADRTTHAYDRYLERAEVGDVTLNPSLSTRQIDEVLRTLPGVRRATRDTLLFATPRDDGKPKPWGDYAEIEEVIVRGSQDGRRAVMDRPVVVEGHMPAARDEVVVTVEMAERDGYRIGDSFDLGFYDVSNDVLAQPGDLIAPSGLERVTVVGIVTLHDEVLPDQLYPRGQMLVHEDLTATYDCLPEVPPRDADEDTAIRTLLPEGCASSYAYYSLELEGGPGAVPEAVEAYTAIADELNAELPPVLLQQDIGYYVIATTTDAERERVARSVQPTTAALSVLGLGAAVVTVVVVGLMLAREQRRAQDDVRHWWRLGLSLRDRATVLLVPALLGIVLGVAIAVLVAWIASPLGPVGNVRAVEPDPARELSSWAALGALALAAVGALGALLLSVRSARRAEGSAKVRPRVLPRVVQASGRPAVDEGLRAAWGGNRGAALLVGSGGVAVGVLLAATVFGASLSSVLSTPASYGWTWDLGVMGGSGYGRQDLEAVEATLAGQPEIEAWTGLAIRPMTVDDEPVMAIAAMDRPDQPALTIASGELPTGPDEVALGSRTADAVGAEIGDRVVLAGDPLTEPTEVVVTGIAVLPALGPYLSDRAAPGAGVLVSPEVFGPEVVDEIFTFVGADLAEGASPAAVLDSIRGDFPEWALFGDAAYDYAEPVRPPEIIDAESMRTVPVVVGGLLAVAAAAGLLFAAAVSVQARRRELGTLRALGFTGRQLRTSVRVQTLATMASALVLGIPIGIVVGRVAWRSFASELGVLTEPSLPWRWVGLTVVGGLAVALAAAAVPARRASRTAAATILRSE